MAWVLWWALLRTFHLAAPAALLLSTARVLCTVAGWLWRNSANIPRDLMHTDALSPHGSGGDAP
ncbi:hypothetical protein [Musicola keenii]|uniref:hypothetical protein n=1 Tax=Musicola keenii TaxID=2884250 RepID=UPI00177DAA3A|nr:hypothetical protein [Musicola keenii]